MLGKISRRIYFPSLWLTARGLRTITTIRNCKTLLLISCLLGGTPLPLHLHGLCMSCAVTQRLLRRSTRKGSKRSVYSMAEQLTHDTLGRMDYLQAALSESLRLHPPVPRDGKVALVHDVLPDGTLVKEGDLVPYVPYSMARMPFMWGSDALEVKPERWLKDGVFRSVSPFKFTTFQAGPRICLGRDSAYLQLKSGFRRSKNQSSPCEPGVYTKPFQGSLVLSNGRHIFNRHTQCAGRDSRIEPPLSNPKITKQGPCSNVSSQAPHLANNVHQI